MLGISGGRTCGERLSIHAIEIVINSISLHTLNIIDYQQVALHDSAHCGNVQIQNLPKGRSIFLPFPLTHTCPFFGTGHGKINLKKASKKDRIPFKKALKKRIGIR